MPSAPSGPVAQLGARFHGMEEVVGSIPTRSTIFNYLPILRFSVWRHLGVTTPEILLLSLKTLGAIPTGSTIFSATCRYPYLQLDLIWLQNAVTASLCMYEVVGAIPIRSTIFWNKCQLGAI